MDALTGVPLEPESEFIIKVQDINDNEPRFRDGPYSASVPEMSPSGEDQRWKDTRPFLFFLDQNSFLQQFAALPIISKHL